MLPYLFNEKILIILEKNKKIFSFKIKDPCDAVEGEADIMLEAGSRLYFKEVIAGNYFRHFKYPNYKIKRISWRGYFEYKNRKYICTPLVKIKHKSKNSEVKVPLYHFGSIIEIENFAFPVCSLYVPQKLDTKHIGKCKLNENNKTYVDIKNYKQMNNVRIEFIILTNSISIDDVRKSHSYIFYLCADIDSINTTGNFVPLLQEKELLTFNIGGHGILLRLVCDPNDMYREANSGFSLVITEPNNLYRKNFDREIITYYPNGNKYECVNSKDLNEREMSNKNINPSLEKAITSILKSLLK